MISTASGAMQENTLEMLLVSPMSVPAWTGEMSMWLIVKPHKTPPFIPTLRIRMINVRFLLSVPTKFKAKSAKPGIKVPRVKRNNDKTKNL